MGPTIAIRQDRSEQRPLLFPEHVVQYPQQILRPVNLTITRIPTGYGDYDTGLDHLGVTACERKKTIPEVSRLFWGKNHQYRRAFDRFLTNIKHPILFLDFDIDEARRPAPHRSGDRDGEPYPNVPPHKVLTELWRFVSKNPNLRVIGPTTCSDERRRMAAGEMLLYIMCTTTGQL